MPIAPVVFFAAVASPVRLRCLMLPFSEGELCVCEPTPTLGLSQPALSRHLAVVRDAGIVVDLLCLIFQTKSPGDPP